jgi:hypothetical protein
MKTRAIASPVMGFSADLRCRRGPPNQRVDAAQAAHQLTREGSVMPISLNFERLTMAPITFEYGTSPKNVSDTTPRDVQTR